MPARERCVRCHGLGYVRDHLDGSRECGRCEGEGYVLLRDACGRFTAAKAAR
jgi:RecJ-like exonuclease